MTTINAVRSSVSSLIKSRILMSGPMPVADYMRMALTSHHPKSNVLGSNDGYYMKNDVFGQQGDFITSPEICQIFGELLAVWGLETQIQIGGPKKFNIVELGPGRGTLSKDILRVFKQFDRLTGNEVALHLVEISPYLASTQAQTLCSPSKNIKYKINTSKNDSKLIDPFKETLDGTSYYHHDIATETGNPVYWYRDVKDLPRQFNFYIAHEFFDALPVHKLQKVEKNWREVLIDVDPSSNNESFRFVSSRNDTPVIKILQSKHPSVLNDNRQHLEVSLEGLRIIEELKNRLEEDGGIGLVIDYGHDGSKEDTFRGFYKHQLHDPLVDPGTADLTADVDFSLVKKLFSQDMMICGPVTQHDFLTKLGIEYRLQALLDKCKNEDAAKALQSGHKMIMEDMGTRFLFMGLFPKILEKYTTNLKIAGF